MRLSITEKYVLKAILGDQEAERKVMYAKRPVFNIRAREAIIKLENKGVVYRGYNNILCIYTVHLNMAFNLLDEPKTIWSCKECSHEFNRPNKTPFPDTHWDQLPGLSICPKCFSENIVKNTQTKRGKCAKKKRK